MAPMCVVCVKAVVGNLLLRVEQLHIAVYVFEMNYGYFLHGHVS